MNIRDHIFTVCEAEGRPDMAVAYLIAYADADDYAKSRIADLDESAVCADAESVAATKIDPAINPLDAATVILRNIEDNRTYLPVRPDDSLCVTCFNRVHGYDPDMGGDETFRPGKCKSCGYASGLVFALEA